MIGKASQYSSKSLLAQHSVTRQNPVKHGMSDFSQASPVGRTEPGTGVWPCIAHALLVKVGVAGSKWAQQPRPHFASRLTMENVIPAPNNVHFQFHKVIGHHNFAAR